MEHTDNNLKLYKWLNVASVSVLRLEGYSNICKLSSTATNADT